MIDELIEELYAYNFLRQIFLKEPSKEFLSDISRIEITRDADDPVSEGLIMIVDEAKKNAARLDEWTEELGLEYARLFIGPFNPPAIPYASFYLSKSRSLMADETIDVRKRYLEAGMSVKELYSTPDDHIGIELEFIYYLTQKIIESLESGEREEASELFKIRTDFISQHMGLWVPFFADKVVEATHTDFFRGAADMLKGLI